LCPFNTKGKRAGTECESQPKNYPAETFSGPPRNPSLFREKGESVCSTYFRGLGEKVISCLSHSRQAAAYTGLVIQTGILVGR